MSSIFDRAAAKGKVQTRTPFLDTKGIFKTKFAGIRSGENQSGLAFVAIDVEVLDAKCPDPSVRFVPGETRTLMNTEPADRKLADMFNNTLVTWGLAIARALHAQGGGSAEDAPGPSDVTAEVLTAFFGPDSILVGREITIETMPRTTKAGKTVWNYQFSA
jgi:hypothetical protein